MYKVLFSLLFLCHISFSLFGQITPYEGSALNYRIIGFSIPPVTGANKYTIEIARGTLNAETDFQNSVLTTVSGRKNKIIAEVPEFGAEYTWQAVYDVNGKTRKSNLHHFTTKKTDVVDTALTRLKIFTPAADEKDKYIFVDGNEVLYDMAGHPVWYLPAAGKSIVGAEMVRDLKASPLHTITFITSQQAYEIDYNGNVLWKDPEKPMGKRNISKLYHHQFSRLPDGHYMVLGFEADYWKLPDSFYTSESPHPGIEIKKDNGTASQKILFGKLLEFDQNHNLLWSWSSANYIKKTALYSRKSLKGFFDISTHENSFCIDENKKTIYLSCRDLNSILKIQYPSGKVIGDLGAKLDADGQKLGNGIFCGQHSCMRSANGDIYLYNNNTCNRSIGQLPTIVVISSAHSSANKIKKIWDYECNIDELSETDRQKYNFESGGSVYELQDGSFLCCMGGTYSKVFIVGRDKKVRWSALPQKWDKTQKQWKGVVSYRASFITRKELEDLIWGESLKKQK